MLKAPIFSVSRLRMLNDGEGITTLVGFYSCPLRCKYCLNPQSFDGNTKYDTLSAEELVEKVKIDDLYFKATRGGVTFGGGEPLLYADFIKEFREKSPSDWRITVETSLFGKKESVTLLSEIIDEFIIDVKETHPEIYKRYTSCNFDMVRENLKLLKSLVPSEKVLIRLPLISGFNNDVLRRDSEKLLREMGFTRFDLFEYKVK